VDELLFFVNPIDPLSLDPAAIPGYFSKSTPPDVILTLRMEDCFGL